MLSTGRRVVIRSGLKGPVAPLAPTLRWHKMNIRIIGQYRGHGLFGRILLVINSVCARRLLGYKLWIKFLWYQAHMRLLPFAARCRFLNPQYPGTYAVWCQKEGVTEPDAVSRIQQVLYNRGYGDVILPLVV